MGEPKPGTAIKRIEASLILAWTADSYSEVKASSEPLCPVTRTKEIEDERP